MSFYISPPGGNISLLKLTEFAVMRFNFLAKVYDTGGDRLQIFDIIEEESQIQNSECLIEGTVKDRLSHFILRLASCHDREMSAFLVKAETLLFDFRFNCMTEEELCKLFKSVEYHRKSSKSSDLPVFITNFLKTMSLIKDDCRKWRTAVKKYIKGDMDCFTVPFWTVLHLVAKRQVVLEQGLAEVPFCKLRETVTSLFEELTQRGIAHAAKVFKSEDQRIKILIKTIKVMFYKVYKDKYPEGQQHYDLCHTDVDTVSEMFPPCMSHLHKSLRRSHRLKHHSRIQYTLFLKEIGLPIHEALMFWRKEYMQPPHRTDSCLHTWSKDERRYTYNIRHLYGLEGSRINYRGHSCIALQESYHGPNESGGCPFSHFDSSHLLELLHDYGVSSSTTEQILALSREKQYSQACAIYFMVKLKANEHEKGLCEMNHQKFCGINGNPKSVNSLGTTIEHVIQDTDRDNIDNFRKCCHGNNECKTGSLRCFPHAEIQDIQKKNVTLDSRFNEGKFENNQENMDCHQDQRRTEYIVTKPAEYYHKFKLLLENSTLKY